MGAISPLKLTGAGTLGRGVFFVCAAKVEALNKVRRNQGALSRKTKRAGDGKCKPI
jgi:hypothetical protein